MSSKIRYYIRLDDACETMDYTKWCKMVDFLIENSIYPLIGVIPFNKDQSLILSPEKNYWELLSSWQSFGCKFALHGYNHIYDSKSKGINPIHARSEFAGHSLDIQKKRLREGFEFLTSKGLEIESFFAPSHTFDLNTLKALKEETPIRVISDTIALRPYQKYGFTFLPVQSGLFRKFTIPGDWTFCFHPNTMDDSSIELFKDFIISNRKYFKSFQVLETKRKKSIVDKILSNLYFVYRNLR